MMMTPQSQARHRPGITLTESSRHTPCAVRLESPMHRRAGMTLTQSSRHTPCAVRFQSPMRLQPDITLTESSRHTPCAVRLESPMHRQAGITATETSRHTPCADRLQSRMRLQPDITLTESSRHTPCAVRSQSRMRRRAGITLTEILIAIMILGVGLVSLATLFPIGLLRLRDASRYSRTKYLVDSAGADGTARALFSANSFAQVDAINYRFSALGLTPWYVTAGGQSYGLNPSITGASPLTQDTPGYGQDYFVINAGPPQSTTILGANSGNSGGYGLPFAYDPLWRYQTLSPTTGINGYYLGDTFEARFGQGIGFIRDDPTGGMPSAHGLQRITNFNRPFIGQAPPFTPIMPISAVIPSIFVSQEDVVWVEALASSSFSSVLPDLSLPSSAAYQPGWPATSARAPALDWHYSWMFTGYQVSSSGGSTFEGNIVIFENRPFGIDSVPNPPNPNGVLAPNGTYQVEGETVVEAIFGHSGNVPAGGGYAAGADRTVLLRWYASQADPVVKPGDWIADVTYERQAQLVYNATSGTGRFLNGPFPGIGIQNPFNNGEWDNLPAQRCIWYQVQKVTPAIDDIYPQGNGMRSMVVIVDRSLQARTVLNSVGMPAVYNAALISPYVINVIPQQFTVKY